jgi:hypothetical protein
MPRFIFLYDSRVYQCAGYLSCMFVNFLAVLMRKLSFSVRWRWLIWLCLGHLRSTMGSLAQIVSSLTYAEVTVRFFLTSCHEKPHLTVRKFFIVYYIKPSLAVRWFVDLFRRKPHLILCHVPLC